MTVRRTSSHTRLAGIAPSRRGFALKGQASQSFKDLIRCRPFPEPALDPSGRRGRLTHGARRPAGRGIVRSDVPKSRIRSLEASRGDHGSVPGNGFLSAPWPSRGLDCPLNECLATSPLAPSTPARARRVDSRSGAALPRNLTASSRRQDEAGVAFRGSSRGLRLPSSRRSRRVGD